MIHNWKYAMEPIWVRGYDHQATRKMTTNFNWIIEVKIVTHHQGNRPLENRICDRAKKTRIGCCSRCFWRSTWKIHFDRWKTWRGNWQGFTVAVSRWQRIDGPRAWGTRIVKIQICWGRRFVANTKITHGRWMRRE